MRDVTRYMVIEEEDLTVLEENVNAAIADGWQPQGGVTVICVQHEVSGKGLAESTWTWTQALVKK